MQVSAKIPLVLLLTTSSAHPSLQGWGSAPHPERQRQRQRRKELASLGAFGPLSFRLRRIVAPGDPHANRPRTFGFFFALRAPCGWATPKKKACRCCGWFGVWPRRRGRLLRYRRKEIRLKTEAAQMHITTCRICRRHIPEGCESRYRGICCLCAPTLRKPRSWGERAIPVTPAGEPLWRPPAGRPYNPQPTTQGG